MPLFPLKRFALVAATIALLGIAVPASGENAATRPQAVLPVAASDRKPTPEEWGRVDRTMADLLRSRDWLRVYIKSMAAQLGTTHRVVTRREQELKDLLSDIEAHAEDLDDQFILREGLVARPPTPLAPAFGDITKVKRIVFVCDASKSMINKFSGLKNTLNRSIANLKDGEQSFNIVFYQDAGKVQVVKANGVAVASQESKRDASNRLEGMTTSGEADPIPALRFAFAQQPDLIVFQSNGELPDRASHDRVIKEISDLNLGRKVKVNTVLFSDPYDTHAKRMLRVIARENGGSYSVWKEPEEPK